jgi:hypothetical protein
VPNIEKYLGQMRLKVILQYDKIRQPDATTRARGKSYADAGKTAGLQMSRRRRQRRINLLPFTMALSSPEYPFGLLRDCRYDFRNRSKYSIYIGLDENGDLL